MHLLVERVSTLDDGFHDFEVRQRALSVQKDGLRLLVEGARRFLVEV